MIVGIAGYARAGKDSVAAVLVAERGFKRIAFADALKAVLADVDPLLGSRSRLSDRLSWHGWEAAKAEPEVRQLLQRLGVACRDRIGPHVWVDAVFRQIEEAFDHEGPSRWVIPDVRFPNELAAVEAHGGQVWRVRRPGHEPVNGHISETALDCAHFGQVIENAGTLEDLRRDVLDLTDLLLGEHV